MYKEIIMTSHISRIWARWNSNGYVETENAGKGRHRLIAGFSEITYSFDGENCVTFEDILIDDQHKTFEEHKFYAIEEEDHLPYFFILGAYLKVKYVQVGTNRYIVHHDAKVGHCCLTDAISESPMVINTRQILASQSQTYAGKMLQKRVLETNGDTVKVLMSDGFLYVYRVISPDTIQIESIGEQGRINEHRLNLGSVAILAVYAKVQYVQVAEVRYEVHPYKETIRTLCARASVTNPSTRRALTYSARSSL